MGIVAWGAIAGDAVTDGNVEVEFHSDAVLRAGTAIPYTTLIKKMNINIPTTPKS